MHELLQECREAKAILVKESAEIPDWITDVVMYPILHPTRQVF